jgi:hypothetical protein
MTAGLVGGLNQRHLQRPDGPLRGRRNMFGLFMMVLDLPIDASGRAASALRKYVTSLGEIVLSHCILATHNQQLVYRSSQESIGFGNLAVHNSRDGGRCAPLRVITRPRTIE